MTVRKGFGVLVVSALFGYPVLQLQMLSLLYIAYSFTHEVLQPFEHRERSQAESAFRVNAMLGRACGSSPRKFACHDHSDS